MLGLASVLDLITRVEDGWLSGKTPSWKLEYKNSDHHYAARIRRRCRTAWASVSSTVIDVAQSMQPSVMLWP